MMQKTELEQTIRNEIWNYSKFLLVGLSIITFISLRLLPLAQVKSGDLNVGADGIMRYSHNGTEVTGFGINYTVPFAHAYRSAKKLGINLKEAIDQDVYHFARLDFDLFRVHVWDCEISDTLGNLIDNEHLELFDYLLFRLQENGIRAVITPIAYWGNGWPDPDEPTPGFSHKYGKDSCLVDPNAIKAQENYLAQFVNHVNRYTQLAYKTDPNILAFEISNEPHHRGTPEEVTAFVRSMKEAIRATGCTKPIFYNVSHSIHLAPAYYAAGIDGGTFQWYPTGLGFQKELGGNLLPNVDHYTIPFDDILKKEGSARIVYEFDAADMASTYMYPAMARSFRAAGIQLATHFSYDPTFLAPYNTEYNTHYMNLLYAPRKALALMICGEIFRTVPMYSDFGHYPDNTSFGPFRISYEKDLAEMVSKEKFIYTNHTTSNPPAPEQLTLIAGWGNSPLIQYDGQGAYFLDKVGDDAWRLEVMPDVTQLQNLFGRNSLQQKVAVLHQSPHRMKLNLPGLGDVFAIESVDRRDSVYYREIKNGVALVRPGVYLLMGPGYDQADSVTLRSRKDFDWAPATRIKEGNIQVAKPYSSSRPSRVTTNQNADMSVVLFDAETDAWWVNRTWVPGSGPIKDSLSGKSYLNIPLNGLVDIDPENPNADPIADYSMRHYFGDLIKGHESSLVKKKNLVIHARIGENESYPVQVALVMKDGSAFGATIALSPKQNNYTLPINTFKKVKAVLLPRPYPTFLPYYSSAGRAKTLDLSQVESVQVSIGPGIKAEDWAKAYTLQLEKISLE